MKKTNKTKQMIRKKFNQTSIKTCMTEKCLIGLHKIHNWNKTNQV